MSRRFQIRREWGDSRLGSLSGGRTIQARSQEGHRRPSASASVWRSQMDCSRAAPGHGFSGVSSPDGCQQPGPSIDRSRARSGPTRMRQLGVACVLLAPAGGLELRAVASAAAAAGAEPCQTPARHRDHPGRHRQVTGPTLFQQGRQTARDHPSGNHLPVGRGDRKEAAYMPDDRSALPRSTERRWPTAGHGHPEQGQGGPSLGDQSLGGGQRQGVTRPQRSRRQDRLRLPPRRQGAGLVGQGSVAVGSCHGQTSASPGGTGPQPA